jgi:transcriptional regulator with XRE-family HTH domain
MKPQQLHFETSAELKALFARELRSWRTRHRLSIDDLAQRCGVSPSYLAHVGRYGRVPGKPVLLLLALNFELPDPSLLLKAAGLSDPWPFAPGTRLMEQEAPANGFLSVRLDMNGFVEALKSAIKDQGAP